MDRLISYQWPGNVRELQNILKSCLVIGNWEEVITGLSFKPETVSISEFIATTTNEASIIDDLLNFQGENSPSHASFSLKKIRRKVLDRIEKEIISYVLDQTGWNRTKATKILKISYKTLLYKISDLNIKPPRPT
jgi:DNA-binding NtrC family response regulator